MPSKCVPNVTPMTNRFHQADFLVAKQDKHCVHGLSSKQARRVGKWLGHINNTMTARHRPSRLAYALVNLFALDFRSMPSVVPVVKFALMEALR